MFLFIIFITSEQTNSRVVEIVVFMDILFCKIVKVIEVPDAKGKEIMSVSMSTGCYWECS